eukprot:jgi/Undpi1/1203/HiC_scaffold_104.g14117.m1
MGRRSWSTTATSAVVLMLLVLQVESADITVEPGGETIQVDGTEDARITIRGVGGTDNVIVRGSGKKSRLFEIKHDYYTLQDFTIDGQVWDDDVIEGIDEDNASDAYSHSLLHADAARDETERSGGYMSALDGLIVTGMVLQNAGAECLRLRHFTTYAIINGNTIRDCGIFDYEHADDDAGKNGEGVYVGTSRSQWTHVKNHSGGEDICRGNVISNNEIETNVTDNILVNCAAYGVRVETDPQGEICGNEVVLPEGETVDTYEYTGGDYGHKYKPFEECGSLPPSTPAPTGMPSTPSPSLIPENNEKYCGGSGSRPSPEDEMCRCTDTESDVDMHGASADCDMECPRDSVLPCGGDWKVTSWEIV